MRRVLNFVATLFGALAIVACGGGKGGSPTLPSGPSGGIDGTVVYGVVAVAGGSGPAAGAAVTNLTVTVEGTQLSANTDSQGRFTLRGIPAGDPMLRFKGGKGGDVDARLRFPGLNDGVVVKAWFEVTGSTATVLSVGNPPPAPSPSPDPNPGPSPSPSPSPSPTPSEVVYLTPPPEHRAVVAQLLTYHGSENLFPAGNCVNVVLHNNVPAPRDANLAWDTWDLTAGTEGCMTLNVKTDSAVTVERAGPDVWGNGIITEATVWLNPATGSNNLWTRTLNHALTHAAYGMGDTSGSGGATDPSDKGFNLSPAAQWFMGRKRENVGKTLALAPE